MHPRLRQGLWVYCHGMHAAKAKAYSPQGQAALLARSQVQCMQSRQSQPPWPRKPHLPTAKAKACSYCQASPHRHGAKAKTAPIGTHPRPRHAVAKAKAHCHGNASKAMVCMLPMTRPRPRLLFWACCKGQGSPKGTQPRARQTPRAGCQGMHASKVKTTLRARSPQGYS